MDTFEFFVYPLQVLDIATINLQCNVLLAWIRAAMAPEQYRITYTTNVLFSPSNELPALYFKGEWIGGLSNILNFMSAREFDLDVHLSAEEVALTTAYTALLEQEAGLLTLATLYSDPTNWNSFTRRCVTESTPFPTHFWHPSQRRNAAIKTVQHFFWPDVAEPADGTSQLSSAFSSWPLPLRGSTSTAIAKQTRDSRKKAAIHQRAKKLYSELEGLFLSSKGRDVIPDGKDVVHSKEEQTIHDERQSKAENSPYSGNEKSFAPIESEQGLLQGEKKLHSGNRYVFGGHISTLDCFIFGYLSLHLLVAPGMVQATATTPLLADVMSSSAPLLVRYMHRMTAELFTMDRRETEKTLSESVALRTGPLGVMEMMANGLRLWRPQELLRMSDRGLSKLFTRSTLSKAAFIGGAVGGLAMYLLLYGIVVIDYPDDNDIDENGILGDEEIASNGEKAVFEPEFTDAFRYDGANDNDIDYHDHEDKQQQPTNVKPWTNARQQTTDTLNFNDMDDFKDDLVEDDIDNVI